MPLDSGTKLGPYEISGPLGAGGMGEVYKAADTRLNRTVAIKVLPPHLSDDLERRQRFEREAQTIASLNHPNICTLYDVGRQGEVDFLVMEYLQGETLASRLARDPMPLDEALKVAIQIADALEKAHGQGVTHRDLKPGNVMLTEGGAKLLDFGLAKLSQSRQPSAASSVTAPISPSATTPGTILGTMQYMAPEQLEGKEADARTDLFAFGAVLYEMVTGRKAFEGKSQPHLIAAIVSVQPDPIAKSQPSTPPALDFLVRRCLEKDPEQRLQTATDLVWELRWIAGGGTEGGVAAPSAVRRRRATLAQFALATLALLVVAMGALIVMSGRRVEAREETRFLIDVPDMPTAEAVAISPDGRTIAYAGRDGASTAVFVRPIGREVPRRLEGTEGAGRLFFSPDSRWIAFFADGRLKKVEASGGPPQNVCETPDLLGGTWNAEDVILFASSKGLQRVIAAGGQPTPVPTGDTEKGGARREPFFLPDGRHYLYLAGSGSEAAIHAGSIDSTDATRLVTAESNAMYVEPGFLLYHREGTLYAQPLDGGGLSLNGEAVRIADRLPRGSTGAASFAASNTGVLVVRNDPPRDVAASGAAAPAATRPLLWVSRAGRGERASAPAAWTGLDLAPDGKRVAVHRHESGGGDVWILDAGQETPSRFTFEASQDNSMPLWSPDGTRIAFASQRGGKWGLYVKLSDNTRGEESILESENPVMPMSWSGNRLVYWSNDPKTAGDIYSVDLTGERKATAILQTAADERNPQVSPDGKWLAYSSNETARSEIYVRPFPDGPSRIQVSVNGGVFPRWRRDSRELYFMSLVSLGAMMASDIRVSGSSIQRDVPHRLFQSAFISGPHAGGQPNAYAVSADGQRFLIPQFESPNTALGGTPQPIQAVAGTVLSQVIADRRGGSGLSSVANLPITVVLGWDEVMKR
jgi:eukaryotic-like serine/threonine-protein kinase